MSDFNAVPIVDVHKDNFVHLWPAILLAIRKASFIAMDTELSGIGDRRGINAKSIDDRYAAICAAARSRSIISVGISCFQLENRGSNGNTWNYVVQTFNLTTLCSEEYTVEPEALKFLIGHGFDFNKQYSMGIPYYKGNDKEGDKTTPCLRQLFLEIVQSGNSIVLHNAIIDLLFMYQCWYADLPPKLPTFLKDLHDIYTSGLYDTKYITEFQARTPASYLEYIFRKLQRENEVVSQQVRVQFLQHDSQLECLEFKNFSIDTTGVKTVASSKVCMTYANHGWCPNGHGCRLSHNVDCVLDMETAVKGKKRRKRMKHKSKKRRSSTTTTSVRSDLSPLPTLENCDHSQNGDGDNQSVIANVVDHICNDVENNLFANGDIGLNKRNSPEKVIVRNGDSLTTEPGKNSLGNGTNSLAVKEELGFGSEEGEIVDLEEHNAPLLNLTILQDAEKLITLPIDLGENDMKEQTDQQIAFMNARLSQKSSGHRAGCDAFMTGFVLAIFLARYGSKPSAEDAIGKPCVPDWLNKVYLSGKDVPLLIQQSVFAKHSKGHLHKIRRLRDKMEI